jgi:outer membrane receptor protein involved in Fe transport
MLRLNLAAFRSSYKSLQVIVDTGIAPTVENAGDASISGFEAEGDYALPLGIHLNGGLGYADAHYTQISQGAQAGGVLLGNKLPYVSKPPPIPAGPSAPAAPTSPTRNTRSPAIPIWLPTAWPISHMPGRQSGICVRNRLY